MTNSKKDTFSPETENWLKTRKANEQKLGGSGCLECVSGT